MTPFGKMTLPRKIYQADRGGQCHVPLDAAWGMQGEFAAPEVREAVLSACGLVTPGGGGNNAEEIRFVSTIFYGHGG